MVFRANTFTATLLANVATVAGTLRAPNSSTFTEQHIIEGIAVIARWTENTSLGPPAEDSIIASTELWLRGEATDEGRKNTASFYCEHWGAPIDNSECEQATLSALAAADDAKLRVLATVSKSLVVPSLGVWLNPVRRDPAYVAAYFAFNQDFSGYCARDKNPRPRPSRRTAVIINGELRFRDSAHFGQFEEDIYGSEIFIATYRRYFLLANMLTSNSSRIMYLDEAAAADRYQFPPIFQWLTLDYLLKQFKQELATFDVVVRVRTDIDASLARITFAELWPSRTGVVHCQSDLIFYAAAQTFVEVFSSMYENIGIRYYEQWTSDGALFVPLDWEKLLESDLTNVKWWWFHLPRSVFGNGSWDGVADAKPRTPLDLKVIVSENLEHLKNIPAGAAARQAAYMEWNHLDFLQRFNSETFLMYQILNQGSIICGIPLHFVKGSSSQLYLYAFRADFHWLVRHSMPGVHMFSDVPPLPPNRVAEAPEYIMRADGSRVHICATSNLLILPERCGLLGRLDINIDGKDKAIHWKPRSGTNVFQGLASDFVRKHPGLGKAGCDDACVVQRIVAGIEEKDQLLPAPVSEEEFLHFHADELNDAEASRSLREHLKKFGFVVVRKTAMLPI